MDWAFWVSAPRKKERKNAMKRLSLLFVLFCASLMTMAQDVIVKKDGSTIQSKVMEINGTEIKYKKWTNQDGPMYSISRNEVNSINYQNGEVELITAAANLNQSSWSTIGRMERDGRNLVLNGRELSDDEVLSLVGQENYETYLSAKKQIGVGRAFTPVFWVSLGATVVFMVLAIEEDYEFYYPMQVFAGLADVSLPLMCIFKGVGKGRMNWVADEYNRNGGASAFSYQVSPSIMRCNPMVSQNNLGLGMTFSVNF